MRTAAARSLQGSLPLGSTLSVHRHVARSTPTARGGGRLGGGGGSGPRRRGGGSAAGRLGLACLGGRSGGGHVDSCRCFLEGRNLLLGGQIRDGLRAVGVSGATRGRVGEQRGRTRRHRRSAALASLPHHTRAARCSPALNQGTLYDGATERQGGKPSPCCRYCPPPSHLVEGRNVGARRRHHNVLVGAAAGEGVAPPDGHGRGGDALRRERPG